MAKQHYRNSWGNVYRLEGMKGDDAVVTCVAYASGGEVVTVDEGKGKVKKIVPITIKPCSGHQGQYIGGGTLKAMQACDAPA